MKNTKLKILSIPFVFGIVIILLPSNNSYSDNTVGKIQSSVVYDNQVIDRGLDNESCSYSALDISDEQDDSEMEIMRLSIGNYSIEQPIEGITMSLSTICDDDIEKLTSDYMWTTDRVNLRLEASTNSDIILTLDKRIKVEILKKTSSKWTKVKYEDYEGYIYSTYLRDTELPSLDFTDEEIDLLAKIIWLESRGESDEGIAMVTTVIINRILSTEFPDTLYEVLSKKGEFSTWKLLDTAKPTEREYEIIDETLNGLWDGVLTEDYVYFSTKPRNNHGTIKIGNHFFCKN